MDNHEDESKKKPYKVSEENFQEKGGENIGNSMETLKTRGKWFEEDVYWVGEILNII